MTELGSSLEAIVAGGTQQTTGLAEPDVTIEVNPNHVVKARYVIRQLKAAGLKTPFDFDIEEAASLWATQIGSFNNGVLDEAIQEWIVDPEQTFPTVGEFAAICQWIVTENMRRSAAADAAVRGGCTECEGVRWVRVEIPKAKMKQGMADHFMRPCSQCPGMATIYDLYDRGHFDAEHKESGCCSECREYHHPWRKKRKSA